MSSIAYDITDDNQDYTRKQTKKIYVRVFFDGTCNNRKNIEACENYRANKAAKSDGTASDEQEKELKAYEKNHEDGGENDNSYHNDHTNVDIHEKAVEADDVDFFKIYIEGSGTVNLEGDDTMDGTGFGKGENGIRGKVKKACEEIADFVNDEIEPSHITTLVIDVFGFSRGAAAARNFVHEVTRPDGFKWLEKGDMVDLQIYFTGKDVPDKGFLGYYLNTKVELTADEIKDLDVSIRFVGLYDTVASYTFGFESGAKRLKMHEIDKKAKRIFHLTAKDEHRDKFSLTPVNASSKAKEMALYGVHSDIGGGYFDYRTEEWILYIEGIGTEKLEAEWKRLVENRWYSDKQLDIKNKTFKYNQLIGKRKVYSIYTWIPLNLMVDEWKDFTKNQVKAQYMDLYIIEEPGTRMVEDIAQRMFKDRMKGYFKSPNGRMLKKELIHEMDLFVTGRILEIPTEGTSDGVVNYFYEKIKAEETVEFKNVSQLCKDAEIDCDSAYLDTKAVEGKVDKLFELMIPQIYLGLLRNRHLHWSARYNGLFEVHKPRIVNDRRVRKIISG